VHHTKNNVASFLSSSPFSGRRRTKKPTMGREDYVVRRRRWKTTTKQQQNRFRRDRFSRDPHRGRGGGTFEEHREDFFGRMSRRIIIIFER